jgi:hypothetical protein
MIRMAMSAAKSRLEKTGERMAPRLFMRVATRNTYYKKKNIFKRHIILYTCYIILSLIEENILKLAQE